MATEPEHSETMSGAPSSSEPADFGANAALILAALSRIEAVVRDERAALANLRASLAEMAQAIARAKAVADSENAAAMLDEFEHRVDTMIEIAGGVPVADSEPSAEAPPQIAEQAAESDQVPTVSGVVLRLGPGDTAPEPIPDAEPSADSTGDKGPTVAMLTAMVEALSASIQTPTPEPEPEIAPPASQMAEPTPPASAAAPEFTPWPAEAEAAAMTEPEPVPAPETVAEATPAALPGAAFAQESTLLASFERMETRPFPPPEVGTAVIFTTRNEPETTSQAEPGFVPPAPPPAPAATADPAPAAAAETAAPQPLTAPVLAETQLEPTVPPPPAAMAEVASVPDVVAAAAPEEMAQPSEAPTESTSGEAYFDPTDFLFGPEPEPDPAAFLLDPAPPPQTQKAVLPQPEFVSMPSEPPHQSQPEPPQAGEPQAVSAEIEQPTSEPAPHDPLHALKAMSPNEKLAIFS